jgi:hypothetical protein
MQLPVSHDQSSVATSRPVMPHAEPAVFDPALTPRLWTSTPASPVA